jgi:tetrahydromethanopterin S-methyltransferase subunit G
VVSKPPSHAEIQAVDPVGARLDKIDEKLDEILSRLAKGDTAIALLEHRIGAIERIVYGLCGLVLTAVAGGIIGLVVLK